MDLGLLRSATRTEHEHVETLMPLMSSALTRATYTRTLECLLPLLAGWEAWMDAHAPAEFAALVAERHRSPQLRRDLACLGARTDAPAEFPADRIPGLGTSAAAFLGAMYVVEGSTLGGQHIARHVEPLLGLSADWGTTYFRGYGEQTSARWKEFQQAVLGVPESDSQTLIEAARAMFGVFGDAILPLQNN